MAGTSEDTLDQVIKFLWQNQREKVDGEKKNYQNNISESLELHRDTVRRALKWLEKWGLATSWKEGSKICWRITWNPEETKEN